MTKAKHPDRFYVYIIFRQSGIPCYVGRGTGTRWDDHRNNATNPHLRAIYRLADGNLPRVKVRENMTQDEANFLEIELIRIIGRERHGGPLVNLTDGGEGISGWTHSPETIIRVAAKNKGRIPYNKGKKMSDEAREKMRLAKLGKKQSPAQIEARISKRRGVPMTAEHKAKIGAANRRPCSPERAEKIRQAHLRLWEARRKARSE